MLKFFSMRVVLPAFVMCVFVMGSIAEAQESTTGQETAPNFDQIVNFFTSNDGKVKTRGLCVGTAQECQQAQENPGLNMFIEFDYNSATLTDASDRNLQEFSRALLDDRLLEVSFAVNGHTDAVGTPGYNKSLSLLRANAVKDRLVELGVSEERLSTFGFGESRPKFSDPFAPGNRRVEISIGTGDTAQTASQ